jgi:hypothetical protein
VNDHPRKKIKTDHKPSQSDPSNKPPRGRPKKGKGGYQQLKKIPTKSSAFFNNHV